jgi:hypothetical protein
VDDHHAVVVHVLAQVAEQFGVFGERSIRIWRAPSSAAFTSGTPGFASPSVFVNAASGKPRLDLGNACRIREQRVRERFEPASRAIIAFVRRFCL